MVELQPLEDLTVWNPAEIFIRVCGLILSEHWDMGRVTSDLLLALVRATGRDVEDMRIVPHRQ